MVRGTSSSFSFLHFSLTPYIVVIWMCHMLLLDVKYSMIIYRNISECVIMYLCLHLRFWQMPPFQSFSCLSVCIYVHLHIHLYL